MAGKGTGPPRPARKAKPVAACGDAVRHPSSGISGVTALGRGRSDVRCRHSSNASSAPPSATPPSRSSSAVARTSSRGASSTSEAKGVRRRPPGPGRAARRPRGAASARPPARWSPPSRRRGWRAPPSWCCRCRCGSSSIDEFVAQTRQRIRNADAALCVVDPELAAVRRAPEPGDPPMVPLRRPGRRRPGGVASAPTTTPTALAILQFTSGSTTDPKGVMLPHRRPARQPRRHRRGGAARRRRRRARVVAAAVPRHGSGRAADPADDDRRRPRARRPAGLHWRGPPAGWSGCRPTAARPPPARTSRTCSPPAPSSAPTGSTCPACASRSTAPSPSIPTRSRRSSRPAARHGLRPGAVFPAFGMAEVAIAGTFPEPLVGHGHRLRRPPRPRDRALRGPGRTRRRRQPPPRPARPAGAGPRDPHRRPRDRAHRCATARSASSRSGARR